MTYRGTVQNGVVVFERESPPEGTVVDIEPVEVSSTGNAQDTTSIWDELLAMEGCLPNLPKDAAKNIDHYLYGSPKR